MVGAIWLLLALASPAIAQTVDLGGAWKVTDERATVVPAGISLPVHAGVVALVKTAEASQKGKGIDDVAQYQSADQAVFVTAYIFFPSYADTALATYATDRAIRERYGPALTLTGESVVAAGNTPNGAIRRLYDHGELSPGEPQATMAGFVRAGSWVVAIRATGPSAQRQDVETAFDAIIGGMAFAKDAPMHPVPLRMAAPCPEPPDIVPAKYLGDKISGTNAFLGGLMGGSIHVETRDAKGHYLDTPPVFPGNGAAALCVKGRIPISGGSIEVLAAADPHDGQFEMIVLDDAGKSLVVEPLLLGFKKGFAVKLYAIGSVEVLGSFDALPTLKQLTAIVDGTDKKGSKVFSRSTFLPNGNTNTEIDADTLK